MPRNPKRVRDPNRSHGRQLQSQPVAPHVITRTALEPNLGPGWQRVQVPLEQVEQLQLLHAATVRDTPKDEWVSHYKEQTDRSMQQLDVVPGMLGHRHKTRNAARWRERLETLLSSMDHSCVCWKCEAPVALHGIKSIDLNSIPTGSSLWPHVDRQKTQAMIMLVNAAGAGGEMRVATLPGVDGVEWRNETTSVKSPLARRYPDTVSAQLTYKGDAILLDGGRYVHEVTRVMRGVRDTVALSLQCVKGVRVPTVEEQE
jgi:hypothetical protein